MSTEFYNRNWRMPKSSNSSKVSNYSMSFDGSSEFINVSSGTSFDFGSNPFSFCGWIKRASIGDSTNVIIHFQKSGSTPTFQIRQNARNIKIDFNVGGVWSFIETSTDPVGNDTDWHHLIITKVGTSMSIYFDGVLQKTGAVVATLDSGNGSTLIGARGGNTQNWTGKLDHFAIFDYALSSSQVTSLYGNSTNGVGDPMSLSTKPVAYYKIGDKAAFNGSEYLVTNAASEVYSPYALDFDGTDDKINFSSSIDLGLNNSVSAWVKLNSGYSGALFGETSYGSSGYFLLPYSTGFIIRIGNTIAFASSYLIPSGSWQNMTVVRNGSNFLLYLNGAYIETVTLSSTTNTKFDIIGNSRTGADPIEGSLSNVSAFNAPLTSTQVTEIYNSGKPSNLNTHSAYSNLVSWWQLGENSSFDGTNWTVLDEKGTNNGTSANMGEDAIVNGVNTTGNGITNGMTDNIVGDSPYSTGNSLSYGMGVDALSTDVPS